MEQSRDPITSASSDSTQIDDSELTYESPIVPESRTDTRSLYDRVSRARKAREDAEERVIKRYKATKDSTEDRRWRVNDHKMSRAERPHVL